MTSDSSQRCCPLGARKAWLVVVVVLVAALATRVPLLSAHRLHEDEALYASWALAVGHDPGLTSTFVDKPPLLPYVLHGSSLLFGTSEAALRLPNLLASMISIPLLYLIGARVYGRKVGVAAAALYVVSPFAIVFSPTVFADPLLVLWMLMGVWAAVCRRPVLGGVALGLAYATKQQGVLLVPLVVALTVVLGQPGRAGAAPPDPHASSPLRARLLALLWLVVGSAPIIGAVTWWDSLRWQSRPSYWERSLTTYGGLEMAPLAVWWERLRDWGRLLSHVFGSPPLNLLLLSMVPVALWVALVRRSRASVEGSEVESQVSLSLLGYVAGYVMLHVAVTFQIWDRYVLILVPLLCLLAAASGAQWMVWIRRWAKDALSPGGRGLGLAQSRFTAGLGIVFIAMLILSHTTWVTATGLPSVGANQDAYDGIEQLAAYARDRLTADSTLYYHWLGWHYGYYLRDVPARLIWYPDGAALAAMVLEHGHAASAIAFPEWRDQQPVREALEGFEVRLVPELVARRSDGSPSFTLYSLHSTASTARWEQAP